MILSFSVTNFGPIKDTITLDLQCGCYKEHSDTTAPFGDQSYNKMIAMFGPNASGKSSFIHALRTMKLMVFNSTLAAVGEALPYNPFLFLEKIAKPTVFNLRFAANGVEFHYAFSYNRNSILSESLHYSPAGRDTIIFERKDQAFTFTSFEKELRPLVEKNLPNKLFLVTASQFNFALAHQVFDFFESELSIVEENVLFTLGRNSNLTALMNDAVIADPHYKSFVLAFLKAADLNIVDISVKKQRINIPSPINGWPSIQENQYEVKLFHEVDGKSFPLPLQAESQGTIYLFGLAVVFYKAFIKDQVIVCDELDASMHPALLKMLIQSFAASASANSQLIFTTHNTSIMSDELFRRDQIWFFDKDEHAQSELFSLADFGARPTDKYERDYLLGRYGAVPAVMTYLKEGDQ
jgi:AAA15 family ATPase/GTPase